MIMPSLNDLERKMLENSNNERPCDKSVQEKERSQNICSKCQYCREYRRHTSTRSSFMCEHPDSGYIQTYFKEHNMQKLVGFIGFGERYSKVPKIKGAPKWCPKSQDTQ